MHVTILVLSLSYTVSEYNGLGTNTLDSLLTLLVNGAENSLVPSPRLMSLEIDGQVSESSSEICDMCKNNPVFVGYSNAYLSVLSDFSHISCLNIS